MLDLGEEALDEVLEKTQVAPDAIDKVFLTGGTSFVPAVRHLFEARFGGERVTAKHILIATGARPACHNP